MINRLFSLLTILILPFVGFLQKNKTYNYRSPLDIPLVLAANFGELRPNHFHMGVDFKTNGKEGLSLHSIDDGFVSRVKVSTYGYGKVIYIEHQNGITSVYAHCSSFKGKLDSIVRQTQIKDQNFEIEIFFTPEDIRIKKGELIALSGNSGSSTAPHLHFELRDTKTEEALNPLVYGFEISDHKAPVIKSLKVYSLTEEGYQIPGKSKIASVYNDKSGYHIKGDLLEIPADYCSGKGGVGFAFDVVDLLDGATNICGLYGSTLKKMNDTLFQQQIDRVSFDHSRFINSHKDYQEYIQSKRKFHKSFKTEHNPLTIYPTNEQGIVFIKPGEQVPLRYQAYDTKGNKSQLNFQLKVLKGQTNTESIVFPSWKYFFPDSSYTLKNSQIEFLSKKHTFYEPTIKNVSLFPPFSFGDSKMPIQYPITVKMKLPSSKEVQGKKYISVHDFQGKTESLESVIEDDWIIAKSIFLGVFSIKTDTIPPTLYPFNFNEANTASNQNRLTWKVIENQTQLSDYDLFIDNKWCLLEYESKGDYLFFDKPKDFKGVHKMEIIVKDSFGNQKIWSCQLKFL